MDVDGGEFAALDLVQHGLAGDAERLGGLVERQPAVGGMLADALAATYDVNLAVTARAADLVERQAVQWVAEFVGFPCAEGAFTSGGMTSNLTGLLVARERALPGCRVDGFAGRQAAVYCSAESHHSVVRAAEAAGIGSAFVRLLAIDERRRLRPGELAAAIRNGVLQPDRRAPARVTGIAAPAAIAFAAPPSAARSFASSR